MNLAKGLILSLSTPRALPSPSFSLGPTTQQADTARPVRFPLTTFLRDEHTRVGIHLAHAMGEADDATAAMAAAMGFSSFGAQNPNKRRKFNPGADAVVDGSPIPLHGRSAGGPKSTLRSGSGSNTTPLGVRVSNSDEIDLDGDLDTAAAATAAPPDVLPHHHEHEDGHDHDDPAPQYLDTSRPSATLPGNGEDNVQSKIDAIVGGSSAVNASISTSSFGDRAENGPRRGRGGFQSNRGRGRDPSKKWWEDYYDPSSLVNPWEKAEQALGLEPRGRWMSWDEAKAAQK